MKTILKSLIVIVAVAAVASVATWAYFTDQKIVDNNTLGSGHLEFTLNNDADMSVSHSLTLDDLVPGQWSKAYSMHIYNSLSTMPIKYRITDKKENVSIPGFYDKLNVEIVHGYCDGGYPGGVNPTYNHTSKLADLDYISVGNSISSYLAVNYTHCFAFYFQLDPSAGNEFQDASAVFDIVVDGTHEENPGWSE